MDFIDLKTQYRRLKPSIGARLARVLEHGQFIMGPEVAELEAVLAKYAGTRYCIAASSGTDTLLIAMMALGIGAGDEVITSPFTFIATGEMIALLGAKPVFVDIDARTYNIDPARIEAAITPRTRAIMPVSLYGQCADFDGINRVAEAHGLPVIEDAAQSFGATYRGRRSCAIVSRSPTSRISICNGLSDETSLCLTAFSSSSGKTTGGICQRDADCASTCTSTIR